MVSIQLQLETPEEKATRLAAGRTTSVDNLIARANLLRDAAVKLDEGDVRPPAYFAVLARYAATVKVLSLADKSIITSALSRGSAEIKSLEHKITLLDKTMNSHESPALWTQYLTTTRRHVRLVEQQDLLVAAMRREE